MTGRASSAGELAPTIEADPLSTTSWSVSQRPRRTARNAAQPALPATRRNPRPQVHIGRRRTPCPYPAGAYCCSTHACSLAHSRRVHPRCLPRIRRECNGIEVCKARCDLDAALADGSTERTHGLPSVPAGESAAERVLPCLRRSHGQPERAIGRSRFGRARHERSTLSALWRRQRQKHAVLPDLRLRLRRQRRAGCGPGCGARSDREHACNPRRVVTRATAGGCAELRCDGRVQAMRRSERHRGALL